MGETSLMKIGYARVSTDEQNLSLQKQALKAAGFKVIIEDQGISGAAIDRPGLSDALARVKKAMSLWSGAWIVRAGLLLISSRFSRG